MTVFLRLWLLTMVMLCPLTMLQTKADVADIFDTTQIKQWLEEGRHWQKSMPDSAIIYYSKVISAYEKLWQEPDFSNLSPTQKVYLKTVLETLNLTGNIYYFDDQYKRAETYYQKSLTISQKAEFTNYIAQAFFDIGYVRYKINNYSKAKELFQKAGHLFKAAKDDRGFYHAMNACGLTANHLGNYSEAYSCFHLALKTAVAINDSLFISDTKINLGILYCEQENPEEGIKLFEDALGYFEKTNNSEAVSDVALNIGVVMKLAGDYNRAHKYMKKSLAIEEQVQVKSRLVSRYYHLAELYLEMNQNKKAYDYIRKTLAVAEEIAAKPFTSECNFLLGKYYFMEKDYQQAIKSLTIAVNESEKNNDQALMAQINLWYAKALFQLKKHNEALVYAQKAYNNAVKLNLLSIQSEAAQILSVCYYDLNRPEKALKWFQVYHNTSDSLNLFEQQKEIKRIEARFNYEKKERENELLRNQTALQEIRLKNHTITNIVLALATLLSIVVIILLISRIKYNRALNREQQLLSLQKLDNITKELEGKERELTAKMMFLNQKNELIGRIISQLQDLQNAPDVNYKEINVLVNELRSDLPQGNWREFETQFVQVHPDFYKRLYERFPQLSSHEQRICAFLRMNLNTKEIAAITGRSSKSIEVTRSRIRKKLDLSRSNNLSSFLASV